MSNDHSPQFAFSCDKVFSPQSHPGIAIIHDSSEPTTSGGDISVPSWLYYLNRTNMISWFSGKSLKLLPPDVKIYG